MPHTLLLAEPRGFCAGVVRAIDVLNDVLDREPPPIYAFHEIVHNRHVVEGFRARGAVFVDSLDEVPEGARIVFSACSAPTASRPRSWRRRIAATCG
jgi:4-hydroxy-3-methylbut-2-en-1-yl diphosphate reductase